MTAFELWQDISAMETGSAMVEIQQTTGDFNALLKSQQTITKGEEVSITYGCLVSALQVDFAFVALRHNMSLLLQRSGNLTTPQEAVQWKC